MKGADAALEQAHDATYRFPSGFAGFEAAVRTGTGARGTVRVAGRRSVELVVDGGEGADVAWVRDEIASIVSHRWPSSYADGDGRYAKKIDGDVVSLLDDPFASAYRVGGSGVTEVHRSIGETRFTIVIAERHPLPDGRYLPAHFTVFSWNVESGRLVRADHFRDNYVAVDGVHLPARREVTSGTDEGLTTRWLELTDHTITGAPEAIHA